MRSALLLTVFDRVDLLEPVLQSWAAVPELRTWHLRVAVEPGPAQPAVLEALHRHLAAMALPDVRLVVNERRLGVAENPYRHLGALFDEGHDFVARTEDDLVVADDVLRLLEHAAAAYRHDPEVAVVCAFSPHPGDPPAGALHRTPAFTPWLWGTWRHRWRDTIGPTWDRDYSTFNGSPGFESGWDWNLNTRVLPGAGLTTIAPLVSRVRNIGVVGQHGTADNHVSAPTFRPRQGHVGYAEVRG